jgi:hypothetical protein
MYHLHPEIYLRLIEQDREREMTQRALERAARSGGEQRPGLARGGINAVARVRGLAAAALTHVRFGGSQPTSSLNGSASA